MLVEECCEVQERGQTAMSQKQFKAMQELAASIRDNRAKVEQKISANTHQRADRAVVISVSKYRSAIERLSKE